MAKILSTIPILPAANVQAAMSFCRDKLGFEAMGDHGDYGLVRRDGAEIHFWKCSDPAIAPMSSAYIRVDGVAALHDEVAPQAGAHIVVPVTEQPWGMREFIVKDPDGNLLKFGEPIEEAA